MRLLRFHENILCAHNCGNVVLNSGIHFFVEICDGREVILLGCIA